MNPASATAAPTASPIFTAVLAHLAQHLAHRCHRSAFLTTTLLEQIATDGQSADALRQSARQLAEILEADYPPPPLKRQPKQLGRTI